MKNIPSKLPDRLVEEGLEIVVSKAKDVPEEYIVQIITKSRQPHVMKFEGHEDAEGRFKNIDAYRKWAEKERIVYLLIRKRNKVEVDVGGIVWFGRRENKLIDPRYDLTFGIRLYEGCVGKGLAVPFMKATHDDLKRFYPNRAIWLDFAEDNIAARKAYSKFGYIDLTEADGRVVMGYHIGA
ncbi:MAG TPA: GNAT family N-acetyltransferase [Candidatus Saccharimonadales bacterium]|nr:GNAT family N-acetyltransferase [Candidatus Saccharimonadales bacterium]